MRLRISEERARAYVERETKAFKETYLETDVGKPI